MKPNIVQPVRTDLAEEKGTADMKCATERRLNLGCMLRGKAQHALTGSGFVA